MADSAGSDLTRHTAEVPLIDQHVHGCWLTEGNRRRFENALNEANTEPLADFDSGFDSQLGFAVRNHCAPILGLPRHVDPQTYWDRRSQFSEAELARRFLQAAGVTDWLVETGIGYDVSGMASVAGLGELSGSHAHEVVRLEQVAEQAPFAIDPIGLSGFTLPQVNIPEITTPEFTIQPVGLAAFTTPALTIASIHLPSTTMGGFAIPAGPGYFNSSATPSLGFFNAGIGGNSGFGNSGSGLSGWFNTSPVGLLAGSGYQNYGGLISGFSNLGSGISGFANTGTLPFAVTSLVSGLANIGNNLSGLFFQSTTP